MLMFDAQAEEEAGIVGEILQSEPVTGSQATKEVSSYHPCRTKIFSRKLNYP